MWSISDVLLPSVLLLLKGVWWWSPRPRNSTSRRDAERNIQHQYEIEQEDTGCLQTSPWHWVWQVRRHFITLYSSSSWTFICSLALCLCFLGSQLQVFHISRSTAICLVCREKTYCSPFAVNFSMCSISVFENATMVNSLHCM